MTESEPRRLAGGGTTGGPDITVIIPTFNRRQLLEEAVASALRLSTTALLEIVVVDDCSTDDTWAWLESLHSTTVRHLRTERNGGQSHARNVGIAHARGRYLLFLDSDDLLEPAAIAAGLFEAQASSADIVVLSWGNTTVHGAAEGATKTIHEAPQFSENVDDVLAGRAVPTSAALYRRAYVASILWDQALRKLDDWDWFCQAALLGGTIARVPLVAYWMRAHGGERATTNSDMLLNAREHHAILAKIETNLRHSGRLTAARKCRLAQYYYKELRVLSLGDREAFDAAVQHIHELDPSFVPYDEERQWWMRGAARLLGTRRAILLHSALKRRLSEV